MKPPVISTHDAPAQPGSCCHGAAAASPAQPEQAHGHHDHPAHAHHAHGHHGAGGTSASLTTSATIHCLTGCAIGEFAGLAIGVSLGLAAWPTMLLATALAYVSGFALSLRPLLKSGLTFGAAWRAIWLGEAISIGVMEIAMNGADYLVGGVSAPSMAAPIFWVGYGVALAAGFAAAWPVNYWMLSRSIKKPCH